MMKTPQPLIYGSFEQVTLPTFSDLEYIAKVDTGAYSGAIHCTHLEEVRTDGKRLLRFKPLRNSEMIETRDYRRTYVRSSTGHRVKRYLITTQMIVRGIAYDVKIGLSDRKDMQYEILIGRRFLREHTILVDVCLNKEYDKEGGLTS